MNKYINVWIRLCWFELSMIFWACGSWRHCKVSKLPQYCSLYILTKKYFFSRIVVETNHSSRIKGKRETKRGLCRCVSNCSRNRERHPLKFFFFYNKHRFKLGLYISFLTFLALNWFTNCFFFVFFNWHRYLLYCLEEFMKINKHVD